MSMYLVVDIVDITNRMVNLSMSHRIEDMRKNVNGTRAIIEFDDSIEFAVEIFSAYNWLNLSEVLAEAAKPEWRVDL